MASLNLVSEIKKCVTFIFLKNQEGKYNPNGTGFFVSAYVEKDPRAFMIYLVSAKHVLQDKNGNFFSVISIRLNRRDGASQYIDIPLSNQKIYTHKESEVDIALCPLSPDPKQYDYNTIPHDMISTKEIIKQQEIIEGDEVFFAGLFESHYGQKKNQPIYRFGKVALMSDEKIEWKQDEGKPSKFLDLYLLECQSYSGNSGSPVFFQLSPFRKPNQLTFGGQQIFLAGIIMGSFNLNEILYDRLSRQNMGIAAVTPSYKLYDILFDEQIIQDRNNAPMRAP